MRIKTPIKQVVSMIFIGIIRVYRVTLGPILKMGGGRCRFHPDCSSYGLEAIEKHGPVKGSWLILKRLAKCGPFHPGGFDPVPPVNRNTSCDRTKRNTSDKQ